MRRKIKEAGQRGWSALAFRNEEYRATMDSLNLFFGAIVGVVFAGLEGLPPRAFATLLIGTSLVVSLILLAVHSRRRLLSLFNLIVLLAAYWQLFFVENFAGRLSPNLFITLVSWAALAIIYEFSPRERGPEPARDIAESDAR